SEVGIMLEPPGESGCDALDRIDVELRISGPAVTSLVGRAVRRNAREALRAGGCGPAREAADAGAGVVHALHGRAVRRGGCDRRLEQRPDDEGGGVAGTDLELLAA